MRLALILTLIFQMFAERSAACKCAGPGTVNSSFNRHELIVYGRVIGEDTINLSETFEEEEFKEVEERLKDKERGT